MRVVAIEDVRKVAGKWRGLRAGGDVETEGEREERKRSRYLSLIGPNSAVPVPSP